MTVSTDIITTIAGMGTSSFSGDGGPATSAALKYPRGLAIDASGTFKRFYFTIFLFFFVLYTGNVYIADYDNNRIRKVTVSTGIITTIAGSSTSGGYSGDNGQATSASFNLPIGVALDATGTFSLYILLFAFTSIIYPKATCTSLI